MLHFNIWCTTPSALPKFLLLANFFYIYSSTHTSLVIRHSIIDRAPCFACCAPINGTFLLLLLLLLYSSLWLTVALLSNEIIEPALSVFNYLWNSKCWLQVAWWWSLLAKTFFKMCPHTSAPWYFCRTRTGKYKVIKQVINTAQSMIGNSISQCQNQAWGQLQNRGAAICIWEEDELGHLLLYFHFLHINNCYVVLEENVRICWTLPICLL